MKCLALSISQCFPYNLTYQISLISLTFPFIKGENKSLRCSGALWKNTPRSIRFNLESDLGKFVKHINNLKNIWSNGIIGYCRTMLKLLI